MIVEVGEVPLLGGVPPLTLHQPELERSSGHPEAEVGLAVPQ